MTEITNVTFLCQLFDDKFTDISKERCIQYKSLSFVQIVYLNNQKRMEKTILLFGLIFPFCLSLKMVPLSEIQEVYFSKITGIDYDDKVGKFTSPKNSLIYFFIQGLKDNQQHDAFRKMQIESVRIAYRQSQIDSAFSQQQSQSQQTKDLESQPIYNDKQSETLSRNREPYQIDFFIVKCLLSLEEGTSICGSLGLNGFKNQTLIFFTQRSEIIEYKSELRQDKILYFLSKVRENSDYGNSDIQFDAELQSMAQKFSFQNKTVQQHAFSFIELIKSYLTMEVLLFVLVFIVVPFGYGYISTKIQQRQNQKRLQKFEEKAERKKQSLPQDKKPKQN